MSTKEKLVSKQVKEKVTKSVPTKSVTTKKSCPKVVEDIKEPLVKDAKVLFVVSECLPFCATGGLADVAGGLPKYINNNSNIDVRVVLPLYSDIPQEYKKDFKFIGNTNIALSWRSIYCGVFSYQLKGVTYYFLDNEYYFKRGGGIYSYFDDGERFAFMSKAVLDILPMIEFFPNIIHCNDWQSALIPIYLKTVYQYDNKYNCIKSIFTLHNTEYQGKFDIKLISDLFGIDAKYKQILEFNKDINLVKGAVVCCDKFTTVSPTYAQEILSPEHSNGLEQIFREFSYKTIGILNGIDYDFYNPLTDKDLFKNYDVNSIESRKQNKTAFQKEFNLNVDENAPLLAIVSRMAKHKGLDLIKSCLENILNSTNIQFVAVGNGVCEYEDYFKYLQNKYPGRVKAALGYSNIAARKAYSAIDIFLMPSLSEPCGISQMIASRYGAVPIVREVGGLKYSIKDFGCIEGGNGYTFARYDVNDLVYSINRAINDFKSTSWQEKIKICMQKDFSWAPSASAYIDLYNQLSK